MLLGIQLFQKDIVLHTTIVTNHSQKRKTPQQGKDAQRSQPSKGPSSRNSLRSPRKRILQYCQESVEEREKRLQQERIKRWRLQSISRRLLPKEAVAKCNHHMIPIQSQVLIHENQQKDGNRRFYSGLQICGSVWACPICAAKVTERRRQELEKAIREAKEKGLHIYFATYTFSHHKKESLEDNLSRFKDARHAVKSGRWAKEHKEKYGIVGSIEVLEVTYGHNSNGWHPHTHELIFTEKEVNLADFERDIRLKWKAEAAKHGLTMNDHGFVLAKTEGAIADYIAKFGKEPYDSNHVWGPEAELTKGHLKKGRGPEEDEHLTPFGILNAIDNGHEELEPVFQEYALAFKGRQQLRWSPGLKKRLQVEEKSDEELAQEKQENATAILSIERPAWKIVRGNDYKAELLELENPEAMRQAIIDLGAEPHHIHIIERVQEQLIDTDLEIPEQKPIPENRPTIAEDPRQTELTVEQVAEILAPWYVEYRPYMTCSCGCQLWRPLPWSDLGDCCNCRPAPLWSNETIRMIAALYPPEAEVISRNDT